MSPDSPAPVSLDRLLDQTVEAGASDLILQEKEPPRLRVDGRIVSLDAPPLGEGRLVELIADRIPEAGARAYEDTGSADFALEREGERWRVALYQQRGGAGANLRRIPLEVPSLEDWGLPPVLKEVADLADGLVLVTGAAGAGKSSTIAALAREILDRRPVHVVTIEDPIEYILPKGQGVVTQREVGVDVPGFAEGLRAALRQQPDVLVVGEIRDQETAATALNAAETGSLVLSTLHTRSAAETLGRMLELFPAQERRKVLGQLGRTLEAVFSQMLLPRKEGSGLVAAVEILRASPQVKQQLAEGDIAGLSEAMETSVSYHRMQTMNQSLAALVLLGVVEREEAIRRSANGEDLDLMLRNHSLAPMEDDPMAESFADYSRIHEFRELKEAHEQELERHREAEAQLKKRLQQFQKAVEERDTALRESRQLRKGLENELEEHRSELTEVRERLDHAVGRLQRQASRLREKTRSRPWWKRLLRLG